MKQVNFKKYLFGYMIFILSNTINSQIVGPQAIHYNDTIHYTGNYLPGCSSYTGGGSAWQVTSSLGCYTIINQTPNSCDIVVYDNCLDTQFNLTWKENWSSGAMISNQGVVLIPILEATDQYNNQISAVFPSQTFSVWASWGKVYPPNSAGPGYCVPYSSWLVNGGGWTGGSQSNNFLYSIGITVPNNGNYPPWYIIDNYFSCLGYASLVSAIPDTVFVHLPDPSVNGPISIGCPNSWPVTSNSAFIYSTTPVLYATPNAYVWNYPLNVFSLTANTPSNQASISLDVISNASGNGGVVSVCARGGTNNLVYSKTSSIVVQYCCTPYVNDNTTLNSGNSPHLEQAGTSYYCLNDIQSTGSATIHANTEVVLMNGFNAVAGSEVHLYNATCTNPAQYYRQINQQDSGIVITPQVAQENIINSFPSVLNPTSTRQKTSISSGRQIQNYQKRDVNVSEWQSGFSVIPNPNKGLFELKLNENFNMPIAISLISPLGNVIKEINNPSKYNCIFDLTNYADGIYAIRLNFIDHTETKTIIKSSQ